LPHEAAAKDSKIWQRTVYLFAAETQNGNSKSKEHQRMLKRAAHSAAIVFLVFLASLTSFAQSSGADTFKAKCAMCHGDDGLGNTPVGKTLGVQSYKAPDVLKLSSTGLAAIVKNGKNKMPAFGAQLTDAQIKDVVQYLRTLQKK
jgi:cytochrome c6